MTQGNGAASSRRSADAAAAGPALRNAVARIVRRAVRTGRGPPIVRELLAAVAGSFPEDDAQRREEVVRRLCALLERLGGEPPHSDGQRSDGQRSDRQRSDRQRWLRETLREGATRAGRPLPDDA